LGLPVRPIPSWIYGVLLLREGKEGKGREGKGRERNGKERKGKEGRGGGEGKEMDAPFQIPEFLQAVASISGEDWGPNSFLNPCFVFVYLPCPSPPLKSRAP